MSVHSFQAGGSSRSLLLSLSSTILFLLFLLLCPTLSTAQAGGSTGDPFNSNAFLASLSFTPGSLTPSFSPETTSYSLLLDSSVDSVRVSTSLQDPIGGSHWIRFNGGDLTFQPAGTWSLSGIQTGVNNLTLQTFAADTTTTIRYQVLLYRPPVVASDNAALVAISFSEGTVTPQPFSSRIFEYELALGGETTPDVLEVQAYTADLNANMELIILPAPNNNINAYRLEFGESLRFPLTPSTTSLQVRVVSQSARVVQTYTFTLRRDPGGVVGDPIFTGLQGQVFQVHGVDQEFYNLLSTTNMQINTQFVFREDGECPEGLEELGVRQRDCWTHPGSYLGSLGIQMRVPFSTALMGEEEAGEIQVDSQSRILNATAHGSLPSLLFHRLSNSLIERALELGSKFDNHTYWTPVQRILIESGSASTGFNTVSVNGQQLKVGDLVTFPYPFSAKLSLLHARGHAHQKADELGAHQHSYLYFASTHKVHLQSDGLKLDIINSDHFLNQHVSFVSHAHKKRMQKQAGGVHGLLGQTIHGMVYAGQKLKYVEGGDVDLYAVQWETGQEDEVEVSSRRQLPSTSNSLLWHSRLWANHFVFNRFVTDAQLDELEKKAAPLRKKLGHF